MILKALSSRGYKPQSSNYGDCILIDTGSELIIYDCGSEKHARRVEEYMSEHGYKQAIAVLSHNDSDHYDGFPYLIEKKLISSFYAQLFLKHKEDIKKLLNDGRVTNKSLGNRITKDYDNIAELSRTVKLLDAIELDEIVSGVNIVGPEKDYALETVAKLLNNSEGDTKDAETAYNAASVQVSVYIRDKLVLLCGDAAFAAIEDKLSDYQVIQLPHHGKGETADKIFDAKSDDFLTVYLVSDNTGDTNGGSHKLKSAGRRVKSTLNGDITYPDLFTSMPNPPLTLGNVESRWSYR